MSTRSNIAILKEDGKVLDIYCHSDGYPSHNGKVLLTHHNSKEAAEKIVSLGDCSFLDEHLEPLPKAKPRYEWRNKDVGFLTSHSFDNPQAGVSSFYMRDRGESGCEATEHNSLEDYTPDNDYAYIWMDGKWHISDPYNKTGWVELTDEIVKRDSVVAE